MTLRLIPLNRTAALATGMQFPPTGEQCVPGMGVHYFLPAAGEGTGGTGFPSWVIGYDVQADIQFHEIVTPKPHDNAVGQWDFLPANAIPGFNFDQWFRHVHLRPQPLACINLCPIPNSTDCNSNAVCGIQPLFLYPYFNCTCPPASAGWVTHNFGRGAGGCVQCTGGQVPSADASNCVDPCAIGYAPGIGGACVDVNDCAAQDLNSCNKDQNCINLNGQPFSCVCKLPPPQVTQLITIVQNVSAATLTGALTQVGFSGVVVTSFSLSNNGALTVTVNNSTSLSAPVLQGAFTGLAGTPLVVTIGNGTNTFTVQVPGASCTQFVLSNSAFISSLFSVVCIALFAALL